MTIIAMKQVPPNSTEVSRHNQKLVSSWYTKYRRELLGRLRKLYGAGPPDSDDLAQIAFEKVSRISNLDSIKEPRAFLFRVAVNAGLDQINRSKTAQKFEKDLEKHGEDVQIYSPETVYLKQEQLQRLGDLIKNLSGEEKEILLRSRFKGQNLSKIANDMNMSVSTASRKLAKLLANLESDLQQYDDTGE